MRCALKVVVTREESGEAMAEWVMFDAAFTLAMSMASQVPIFFGFSTWCKSLEKDKGFKWRLDLERPFRPPIILNEKEMQTFPPLFGEKALLLDGFLRGIDSRNQSKSFRKKFRPSYPRLHSALRTTWQTYRQEDNEKRAERWDRKDSSHTQLVIR